VKISECNADFQIGLLKHDMPIGKSALHSGHFQFQHKISLPEIDSYTQLKIEEKEFSRFFASFASLR